MYSVRMYIPPGVSSWYQRIDRLTHMCLRDNVLIELNEPIDGTLPDLQRGEMRQEIVPHKKAHEHPVIEGPL